MTFRRRTFVAVAMIASSFSATATGSQSRPQDFQASDAYEQAELAWHRCARSIVTVQTLELSTPVLLQNCHHEGVRVRQTIRALADLSGAEVSELGIDHALRDRADRMAKRVSAELRRVRASRQPPPVPTCRGSVRRGLQAYAAGNYLGALCYWLPEARGGNAVAQTNVGLLWMQGLTELTPKNLSMAAAWFVPAANAGQLDAMVWLAQTQLQLRHVDSAHSWLVLAARWGDGRAVQMLSRYGWAVPQADLLMGRQQQESNLATSVMFLIGCAFGSCSSSAPGPATEELRSTQWRTQRAPQCTLNPVFRDMNGLPQVECR